MCHRTLFIDDAVFDDGPRIMTVHRDIRKEYGMAAEVQDGNHSQRKSKRGGK